MGFQSASTFVKVALFLNIFAFVFAAIGIFSPYWLVYSENGFDISLGTFYSCSATTCTTASSSETKDWQQAMFALEILGILCSVPSLVFAVLYVFLPATSGKKWVKFVTLTLALVAGLFVLLGAAVYAAKQEDAVQFPNGFRPKFELGWSFAMAIIGGLLHLAASVFFTLDAML